MVLLLNFGALIIFIAQEEINPSKKGKGTTYHTWFVAETRDCSARVTAHHSEEMLSKTQLRECQLKTSPSKQVLFQRHLGNGGVERQQLHWFHGVPVEGLGSTLSLIICMPKGTHAASWHCNPIPLSTCRTLSESGSSICPCILYKKAEYSLQIPCSHPTAERGFLWPLLDSPLVPDPVPKVIQ